MAAFFTMSCAASPPTKSRDKPQNGAPSRSGWCPILSMPGFHNLLTANLLAPKPRTSYVGDMRHSLAIATLIASTAFGLAPAAAERPIVVELFTSQGCSSCPPADALLHTLAEREDVLALTLPVNIWDYLGWRDTLATSAFTHRQRAYVERLGGRSVYTPQMVIDGVTDAVGSRVAHVTRAIELRSEMKENDVPVHFGLNGDTVTITVGAGASGKEATLWLVRYVKQTPVVIERGENAGETITYANVVREMTPVGMWKGEVITLTIPKASLIAQGYDGCAAILQEDGNGPILGAAVLELAAL